MTSTPSPRPRTRRSPGERRAEILTSATGIALRSGLDQVTLRSVSTVLEIAGGLVSHYFSTVDELLAAVFEAATTAELDEIFTEADAINDPSRGLAHVLSRLVGASRNDITTLWIDAWHLAKRRQTLNVALRQQGEEYVARLTTVLERGRASGAFVVDDARSASVRVLAVLDGLSLQVTGDGSADRDAVAELVFLVAEAELGLARETLARSHRNRTRESKR